MELILIPIIAGLAAAWSGKLSRWIALAGSLAAFAVVLIKTQTFNPSGGLQFVFDKAWFSQGMHFHTAIDGISLVLLLLTNILVPIIVLSSFGSKDSSATLFALVVGMQGALNGVFLSMDGLMFYIFWELALIPVYFICALYGEGERFKTTIRFFIFTFVGSLAMLASLIYLYLKTPDPSSFSYNALISVKLSIKEAIWVGAGLLLAFAVKIPILPLHGWQPDTYTNAPVTGSMLLSAIMLKMGLYGLIRWFFPLVPEAVSFYQPIILTAGIIGVLYGAFIAIRQNDMKRIIAYSSLSHVGLIAAGFAVASVTGLQGGILQMFSHGVNVAGLFLAVAIIERRAVTRQLNHLGGIAAHNKLFAALFLIMVLASTAVPFTNGFPGELLLLKSVFEYKTVWGVLSGLTIILCAVYMLRMYQFSMFGHEQGGKYLFRNLDWHESLSLIILAGLAIFFGLFPQIILDISGPSIKSLMELIADTKEVMS